MDLNQDHAAFLCALLRMSPADKVLNVALALAGAAGDAHCWAIEHEPDSGVIKVLTESFKARINGDAVSDAPVSDPDVEEGPAEG